MKNDQNDQEWVVTDDDEQSKPSETAPAPAKRRVSLSDRHVRKTVAAALFAALAYLVMFVFRIQVAGFLTFDLKDAVMMIGALFLGPVAGVSIAATVALLEMISVSSTGFYGFLMNFLASASFILPAAILYRI